MNATLKGEEMPTVSERVVAALVLVALLMVHPAWAAAPPAQVPVVVSANASGPERIAAAELADYLHRLYPATTLVVSAELPAAGPAILVGSVVSDPSLKEYLGGADLAAPESYAVAVADRGGREVAVVAGADARGTIYGVYALLEKLGCGFYLSYDALPPARQEALTFRGWQIADRPLVRDRLVFDWHNFLSGCSTWNLPDWQRWAAQSQKMGYNAIMVHAYGNNPMVSFTFNGKTKPVGYLSTSVRGRDWSTMHVNDVRRLWGGEVFSQAAFGADAALGPEEKRAEAARQLMQGVFAYAGRRAMEVFFADDVDTISANPQELIATLPPDARFATGGKNGAFWLANPDTPEGYRYYKAQVAALLADYPQITCLVVWFRNGGTPWMDLKAAEMPARWREEYNAAIARTPAAAKFWHSHNMFAIGKITRAFERALKELGHERVRLAAGTWNFAFLPGADLFLPPGIPLIGLDYGVLHDDSKLGAPAKRRALAEVGAHRPLVPVIWAQHDDGNYIGRPYTPFAEFHAKLSEAKASGFGIIHWTTRPLDIFFTSHAKQVWQHTLDQPLRATCDDMAAKSFGAPAREKMGEYLQRWVTDAPKFARETGERFIDRPLAGAEEAVAGCRRRLKLIEAADAAPPAPEQRDRLRYFKGLEEFIAAFHQTQAVFENADALLKKGDLAGARAAMAPCRPEQVIEQFARFASLGGITRGEAGLVVSMNTRWLPHYVRLRQTLGLEAVRYNFGPTSHDPLAQSPGRFTFHFDADRRLWQTLGSREADASTFVLPADVKPARNADTPAAAEDVCRSGIESDRPIRIRLHPILSAGDRGPGTPAGKYRVRLWMLDPGSTAPGQRVFDVVVGAAAAAGGASGPQRYAFAPVKARHLRILCHGSSENAWNSICEVRISTLDTAAGAKAATASTDARGCVAAFAIDGKPDTRWAAQGDGQWIQFALKDDAPTDHIDLLWYEGARRRYKFDLLVSQDGKAWTKVAVQSDAPAAAAPAAPAVPGVERVDLFQRAGGAGRIVELAYPVTVGAQGEVDVTLTPVAGKALICGAVLEPAEAGKQP
jgi:hypothetical protein